jgi:hypothetical protein
MRAIIYRDERAELKDMFYRELSEQAHHGPMEAFGTFGLLNKMYKNNNK